LERLNPGLRACASAALLLCFSCTGSIDGSTGAPVPGGGLTSGGSGSIASSGGASSVGGGAVAAGTKPGVVVVRRLNRAEYNNTVADLLGTKLTPADGFPGDDLGAEFDTVGSALSLSPNYVVAYEEAANALIAELFAADMARQQRVLTCDVTTAGDACAQTILSAFARRAWRRELSAEEIQGLMLPVASAKTLGASPVEGLKAALAGVLLSPFFLFKLELDPEPTSGAVRRLNSQELATRLSYSLWSTMPDEALSNAADGEQLVSDEQVTAQVDRMLADPRADRLLDRFAALWLDFSSLDTHEVSAVDFPKFSPALEVSMEAEARRYLQEFLATSLPVSGLFDSRFTFLDATLASHYGVARSGAGNATEFLRVDTTGTQRQGLLTLGAFLTTTSYANRTSPVRRGEYVFRRLLCDEVPPPPADVPVLSEDMVAGQTLRQRMENHRANPACNACHKLMDPIGFGLENYDGLGAYRANENGLPIDASGILPDGTTFSGAVELGGILAKDERLPRCVTEKFMTFAIGRLVDHVEDKPWLDGLSARAQASGASLSSIIRAIVLSDAFRSRQAGPTPT
jgi:Protein of unknown function (DUF1592)/Protein of unknown function (DUF1588)/Protein of unknown function (DUF1587)/Protein of unknown function (DUF1585)/Protein of unknown function (DUF1595)